MVGSAVRCFLAAVPGAGGVEGRVSADSGGEALEAAAALV
jgi:hypothetical protein